jgi:ATP-dependent Clp protease protease subunit
MGAVLLMAGKRTPFAMPHSRIMIHQPLGGARGQCSDIQIQAKEIQDLRDQLNDLICKHTGRTLKEVDKATDRDNFLGPKESIEFGIIDAVISKKEPVKK